MADPLETSGTGGARDTAFPGRVRALPAEVPGAKCCEHAVAAAGGPRGSAAKPAHGDRRQRSHPQRNAVPLPPPALLTHTTRGGPAWGPTTSRLRPSPRVLSPVTDEVSTRADRPSHLSPGPTPHGPGAPWYRCASTSDPRPVCDGSLARTPPGPTATVPRCIPRSLSLWILTARLAHDESPL